MQDHSEPRGATAARLGRMNVPAAGGVCAETFEGRAIGLACAERGK